MRDPDAIPFQVVSKEDVEKALFFSRCRLAESGCWIWTASRNGQGYGRMRFRGKHIGAHVASHILFKGPVPPAMLVLHSCDNPQCVNPNHLRTGTHKENTADCISRGRLRRSRGSANHLAKLTDADVEDIRNSTLSVTALSAKYGIDRTNIHHIMTGKTWAHLPMPEQKVRKAHARTKLTPEQVLAIRSSDASLGELAHAYSVGKPLISMIRNGRIWKSVGSSVEETL